MEKDKSIVYERREERKDLLVLIESILIEGENRSKEYTISINVVPDEVTVAYIIVDAGGM